MNSNLIVILIGLTSLAPMLLQARPSEDSLFEEEEHSGEYHGRLNATTIAQIQVCERDEELMELCMRCAKITKHTTVYPQCCGDYDEVRKWCYDYVYYRQEPSTRKPS
ncbi:uncharacterized protein LOC142237498 [Haematobia irritans]|uniref:uncharacterized protein LOC142237498 n=1 Tax=Haematobia irritans TaxID=7368 RepID=UPI003F50B2C4